MWTGLMAMNGCMAGRLSGIIGRVSGRASTRRIRWPASPSSPPIARLSASVRHPRPRRGDRLHGRVRTRLPVQGRAGRTYGPAEAGTSRTNRRTEQMVNNDAVVRQLYEGFNRRDIPAVLTLLAEN